MKYLELYLEYLERGQLPQNGLCNCLKKKAFDPIPYHLKLMLPENHNLTYWGHEKCAENPDMPITKDNEFDLHYSFTPLRQNILLLMAAMNGEL